MCLKTHHIWLVYLFPRQVEFSLYSGVFVGACIVSGNISDGFKSSLENHFLNAIADVDHAYVYLFTFFLSGVVAMMEKSGGMIGFTQAISRYATTARGGQTAAYIAGLIIFFDDYANTLLVGQSMRPLIDSLSVSREKLSFYVDATSAPVASISPVSSWVGFEIGLIQDELDKIVEREGTEDIGINTSGFAVFLQSIKYRYYPIFMLVLIAIQIFAQRDFVTMLIAERKALVYKRTDGGEASTSGTSGGLGDENQPRKDQPLKSWNMFVPLFLLVSCRIAVLIAQFFLLTMYHRLA
jgi:Na+/H+ antiporter NhaC